MGRLIVALNLSERINDIINFASAVLNALTSNPSVPSPIPPLAVFEAHVVELRAAQAVTLSRLHGSAAERDVKLGVVLSDLESLRSCVQWAADMSPENAGSIIENAGMSVKRVGYHHKAEIEATQGKVSGSVHVVAQAVRTRSFYDWQLSTDGQTWETFASTLKANVDIGGLTVGKRYSFRVRRATKAGVGDWSDPVSLFIG
jgi:hypothetical protein